MRSSSLCLKSSIWHVIDAQCLLKCWVGYASNGFFLMSGPVVLAFKTGQMVTQLKVRASNQGDCPIDLPPKGPPFGHRSGHFQNKRDRAAAFQKGLVEGHVI